MCKAGEVGDEVGATKAISAGVTPKGQDYIWTLVRGRDGQDADEPVTVYATDGACRCCQFPLPSGKTAAEPDGSLSLTCGLCGTRYSLEDGRVLDFLPAANPVQWAAKMANEKKGPQPAALLPTRVSRSGYVYVRLPDGTLLERLPGQSA